VPEGTFRHLVVSVAPLTLVAHVNKSQRLRAAAVLLVALAALGAVAAGLEIQRDRLVADLRALPPSPDAQLIREESGWKPTLAIATHTFASLAQSDLIAEHYTDALQRAGWLLRNRTDRDSEITLCFARTSDSAFLTVHPIGDPHNRYEVTFDWNGPRCE